MATSASSAKRQRLGHSEEPSPFARWARAPPEPLPSKLVFMQVDIDSYDDAPSPNFAGLEPVWPHYRSSLEARVPILRMYGVTEEGSSVCAHIHGFDPYFYVACEGDASAQNAENVRRSLDDELKKTGVKEKGSGVSAIEAVEVVKRSSLLGWQGSGEVRDFFRIVPALPNYIASCRRIVEGGQLASCGIPHGSTTFETHIPFALRFMVDRALAGGGWASVEQYFPRERNSHTSSCQIELDVHYLQVSPVDMIKLAPLRILSFDIECFNPEGKGFPRAEQSPVIQIAVLLKEQGAEDAIVHAVWNLNTCNDIAGAEVFTFEHEADLLISFRQFLIEVDPDVVTGYNIVNFDLPYLLDRAEVLDRTPNGKRVSWEFCMLGRLGQRTRKRVNTIAGREVTDVDIEGRVVFDMMVVIQKEHKLSSYSLNAVSAMFLGEQKEDVHYSMIGDLFKTSAETRRRLAIYCLKDAFLPMQLLEKLLCMYNYVEMARVTGTPINFLLNRGQMIKVTSQLLRKCREMDYVIPALKSEQSDSKYEGATVLDPLTGYYNTPITTLDFASLYPSIMMAHNLCYCTLLTPPQVALFEESQVTKTPTGCYFLKKETRRGLLPIILEELLAARKRAKKAMAEAEDSLTKSVLNGRQLALKISANSVYGFTGATQGILPCLEISASVTGFGREMIDHAKSMVEAKYNIQSGYAHDAQVIYGDTDSVMIKFGVDTVAEAMRLGEEAAEVISATFLKPIKLEFEKVYYPYLLMNKKRYAGLYWTNPHSYDKLDAKGIETVRRDNCKLVRLLVDTSLRKILIDKSIEDAISNVHKTIGDLLQNKVDMSMLVITKSLGKGAHAEDYAMKLAHVELAERMRKRNPATAPGSGDRVPFVMVMGNKSQKAYEKSEDPLFVLENNLSIDAHYYIEQMEKPLLRIFGPTMGDDTAQSRLFAGAHMRKVNAPTSLGGPMAKFTTRSLKCLGCRAIIKSGSLCPHCQEHKAQEVILEKVKELREREQEYNCLWTQCQRCQGSLLEPVICSNSDCEIFYRRAKTRKDLQVAQDQMSRLALDVQW